MKNYDLIIIGAGAGGTTSAIEAASFGLKVALIEKDERVGGAFVLTGTIPSKTLRETALFIKEYKNRNPYGIKLTLKENLTLKKIKKREVDVVESKVKNLLENIYSSNIDLYYGFGSILNENSVKIIKKDGKEEILKGKVILISTGSIPFRNPKIPFDDKLICDSDSILKLDEMPENIGIIGAGVIGLEYASIFSLFGIDVFVIDERTSILKFIDTEIVERLKKSLEENNVKFLLGKKLKEVEVKGKKKVICKFSNGKEIKFSNLLVCTGRIGNSINLGLEKLGIEVNERGLIKVNERFQTKVPNIYAIGDVIGQPALASTAMEQGRLVVDYAFQKKYEKTLPSIIPMGIYTVPEISTVGLTEDNLKKCGIEYEVGRANYLQIARGTIIGDSTGLIKIIASKKDQKIQGDLKVPEYLKLKGEFKKDQLLGAHIIGENASELIHIALSCLYYHGTVDYFIQSVFNFPTLSDGFKIAAMDYFSKNYSL